MRTRWIVVAALVLALGVSAMAAPVELAPHKTMIVAGPSNQAREAAQLLQEWLRKATDVEVGFGMPAEGKEWELAADTVVIALGQTDRTKGIDVKGLYQHGFVIQRKGNVIAIVGGKPAGTFYGAVHFLDKVCGVRFYMPGDLFTGLPKNKSIFVDELDMRIEPYVLSSSSSGYWNTALGPVRTESAWINRVALNRRMGGSHQHTMFTYFNPEKYGETNPEIYPVIPITEENKGLYPVIKDGRCIPDRKATGQSWQPCFTAPALVDIAVAEATAHFQDNPDNVYIAFSIQDKRVQCMCENCKAAYAAAKAKLPEDPERSAVNAQRMAYSDVYWTFMNKVGAALQKPFPDKLIVGIAYSDVRTPPSFKLEPNLVAWKVHKLGDAIIDRVFTKDTLWTQWAEKAGNFGHHDWAQGNLYYIPRVYESLSQMSLQYFDRLGTPHVFTHVEAYPNWGLDGPKLYIRSRLHWDINVNIDGILKNFCDDMFGPASAPMHKYWNTIERLYISLNMTYERKLRRWTTQFRTTPDQMAMVQECRVLLDEAVKLAETDEQKARVDLFSKTFWLSQRLFEMQAAKEVTQAEVDELWKHVNEKLIPDQMSIFRPAYREGWEKHIPAQLGGAIKQVTKGKIK